jgi:hypothetical protein
MEAIKYKEHDHLRIWLEDSVEPEGGFWCYGVLDENLNFREWNFNYDGKEDQLCHINEFNEYKIEFIWRVLSN